MGETEQTTLNLILSAAMEEFLEKGFKSASLRNIVKTAGVTTGAFYGYYDSKEDLFEALVSEQYGYIMDCFCKAQQEFADMNPAAGFNGLPMSATAAINLVICAPYRLSTIITQKPPSASVMNGSSLPGKA